jgi:hypothetical protein
LLTMRRIVFCLLPAMVVGAGCVSEKKAHLEAQQAYLAGQEQAMQAALQAQQQQQKPVVLVRGPVQNAVVEWQEGLKLSQAIVTAVYTGYRSPELIQVLRNGQVVGEFRGVDLINHEDMELQAGDIVMITQ